MARSPDPDLQLVVLEPGAIALIQPITGRDRPTSLRLYGLGDPAFVGLQLVEGVGDPPFEEAFMVCASDPSAPPSLLDAGTRAALLDLATRFGKVSLGCDRGEITIEWPIAESRSEPIDLATKLVSTLCRATARP